MVVDLADPTVELKWYKNGQEIRPSPKYVATLVFIFRPLSCVFFAVIATQIKRVSLYLRFIWSVASPLSDIMCFHIISCMCCKTVLMLTFTCSHCKPKCSISIHFSDFQIFQLLLFLKCGQY